VVWWWWGGGGGLLGIGFDSISRDVYTSHLGTVIIYS